jgi:hypothetical protein
VGDVCVVCTCIVWHATYFHFFFFRASEVRAGELGQGHEFRHAAVDVVYGCKVTAESL